MNTRALWPHARAILVVLHLLVITSQAMPSVGSGLSRAAWHTPTVQGEFEAWSERLQSLGLDVSLQELEDQLWDLAVSYERSRAVVLRPFMPYLRYAGTYQSWRMFVAPHRFPGRLHIEMETVEGWQTIYVARSDEHEWRRKWLDHDRLRALLFRCSWKHYRRLRSEFTDWVSRAVAEDHPEARRVRVSFHRFRTPSPEEVRSGAPVEERRELVVVRPVDHESESP